MEGSIREAQEKDIAVIVEYNYCLAKETEHLELERNRLTEGVANVIKDRSKGIYFLYEVDGKVVAQLMVTKEWSDWRNGEFWWIQSVYVNTDYRRQGLFKKLYQHVSSIVNENSGICGLRLYVEKENVNAQKTYKSLGMEETYYKLFEASKIKL